MPGELKRTLNARDLAIITVGGVIGSGIFLVPGTVLSNSGGSVGLALAIWVVGGVLSFMGALTYAELGGMHPSAGGLYVYLREAFGPMFAFLYGWTLFLVIGAGTVATLAVAASTYLNQLVPLSEVVRKIISVMMVALFAWINVRGTRVSTTALGVATALKVGAIAALVIALPIAGRGFSQIDHWWPTSFSPQLFSTAGIGLVAVLWAYEGWQYTTFVAGETVDPQRNFPRGLAVGTFALIVIYLSAVLAYIAGLGPTALAGSVTPAADATAQAFGPNWATLIAIPIIISMLSAAHANVLTASRVYYAMARDGVFFKSMGEVHPRFGTPAFAVLTSCCWAAVLALTGTFTTLLTYVVFVGWIFYGLGGLAVIALRRKQPNAERPYRVAGYPITPVLFVLSAIAIVVNTVWADPKKGLYGIGGALLGVPIFFLWRKWGGAPDSAA